MKRKLISTAALLAITNLGHTVLRATDAEVTTLKARRTELEEQITILKAKDLDNAQNAEALQNAETELGSVKAQIEAKELRARNEELEQSVLLARAKDAKDAVKSAVKRGAIAAADTELQAKWEKRCTDDPENIELLASINGSPALRTTRITGGNLVVTREDSVAVLRAYNTERDPRKKGEIYARDLSERISKGEVLPLRAGNTLGTLAGEIVAQRTLELLTLEEPMLSMFSTDFSDEGAKKGEQITSRIVGIPGTSDYDADNGYGNNDLTFTDVTLTIDTHKSTQAVLTADDLSGTNRRIFDEVAPAQADAIGAAMIAKAFSVITAANFANKTTDAVIDFGRSTVISMGGALRDRGVRRNRFLLLTGAYYDKLFSDAAIVNLAGQQKPELITTDEMIPIHGFTVTRATTLPAAENLVGFGGGKSSIVVAGRVPNDYANALPGATGGGTSQVITNVKSGFSVHLVQFVDHKLGRAYSRMAFLLGAGKGQTAAGQRLVSA